MSEKSLEQGLGLKLLISPWKDLTEKAVSHLALTGEERPVG